MTLEMKDIPVLEGYVSVAEAARILDRAKFTIYYMIREQGIFAGVRRIGGNPDDEGNDERMYLLIPAEEVERVRRERAEKRPSYAERINAWNKRVKAWGRDNGFHVVVSGQPNKALCEAYLAGHPEDVRPTREERGPAFDELESGREGREHNHTVVS